MYVGLVWDLKIGRQCPVTSAEWESLAFIFGVVPLNRDIIQSGNEVHMEYQDNPATSAQVPEDVGTIAVEKSYDEISYMSYMGPESTP